MGVGILAGGDWLMSEHMAAGRLVRVLPQWRLDGASGIYFVRPSAAFSSAAMTALRDCLVRWFATRSPWRTGHDTLAPPPPLPPPFSASAP